MDSLIPILVVIALSAISSWMNKKRGGEDAEWPETDPLPKPPVNKPVAREARPPAAQVPPPVTAPPVQRRAAPFDWEAELRRMLEGDNPASPPPRVPSPVQPKPAAPPVRPQTIQRAPAPAPARSSVQRPPPTRPPVEEQTEGAPAHLAKSSHSQAAYQRGIQLHEHVGQRLQNVMQMSEKNRAAAPPPMRAVSAELLRTVTMLRNAQSARQALVASIIFAPPKSLEQQ